MGRWAALSCIPMPAQQHASRSACGDGRSRGVYAWMRGFDCGAGAVPSVLSWEVACLTCSAEASSLPAAGHTRHARRRAAAADPAARAGELRGERGAVCATGSWALRLCPRLVCLRLSLRKSHAEPRPPAHLHTCRATATGRPEVGSWGVLLRSSMAHLPMHNLMYSAVPSAADHDSRHPPPTLHPCMRISQSCPPTRPSRSTLSCLASRPRASSDHVRALRSYARKGRGPWPRALS